MDERSGHPQKGNKPQSRQRCRDSQNVRLETEIVFGRYVSVRVGFDNTALAHAPGMDIHLNCLVRVYVDCVAREEGRAWRFVGHTKSLGVTVLVLGAALFGMRSAVVSRLCFVRP
jgi:hypothetical protein